MASTTCRKCGNTCDVIFRRSITVDGKVRYPKNGKVFPIPQCGCTEKKSA